MLATIAAPTLSGQLVEIQCDILGGLPGLVVVGLADKSVEEARSLAKAPNVAAKSFEDTIKDLREE